MAEKPPFYPLDQAIGSTFHQDWNSDYADPYEALEGWFRLASERPASMAAIVRDIDALFDQTPDAASRLDRWGDTGLRVDEVDDLLRAMRKRAVDGLAGSAEPMHAR